MLANIASIEIPPLPQTLVEWLEGESDERLASFGIAREDIDERTFYTRLALGEYLAAQFMTLVDRARATGVDIHVLTQSTVTDVLVIDDGIRLRVSDSRHVESTSTFDYAILATGHQWPPDPEVRPGYFTSPWPASALTRIRNCAVGIRGTALSAIDASVALANQHGEFVATDDDGLQYRAQPGTEQFSISLFSRKGILPEADFYHPMPYEPLVICTVEAIDDLVSKVPQDELLDAAFELFRQEMLSADADYARERGLATQTMEEFHEAYFEERANADPFAWARDNLSEAAANQERCRTVRWRYAILRMHEVFGGLVPHLSDRDFVRFSDTLKAVFVDNYATVPHDSIKRLLALHAGKKIAVHKLDDRMRLDSWSSARGAVLFVDKTRIHFPVFIDATGQQVLNAKDFPFPSLRRQGVVQDVEADGDGEANRGIAVDGEYHPISAFESSRRLFCLSLPFLLGDHPFAQGITSSKEMAEVVANAIDAAEAETPAGNAHDAQSTMSA